MSKSKQESNEPVQLLKEIADAPSRLHIVNSAFADVIKSLNTSTQLFASVVDTQKKLAESIQTTIAPIQQANKTFLGLAVSMKTIQDDFNKLSTFATPNLIYKPLLPNFANLMPKNNTIIDAVQSGFKMAEVFKPLDLSHITKPFKNINDWAKSLIPPDGLFSGISSVIASTLSTFNNFVDSIKNALKNAFEPILRLFKSNYLMVVYASKGDKVALNHLGRLWWKLGKKYAEVERLKGRQPNKQEFEQLVQEVCWLVLNEIEKRDTSWLEAARIAFFAISAKLFVDYVEVRQNERLTEATEVKIISGNYKSIPNIYLHENNKPSLFIRTVAQELGVSAQTVRNWVKTGQIRGTKVSYFSRLRQAIVPAYLLPYHVNLMTQLRTLKDVQDKKKRHQLDGYFTVSQVASWYNLSRKTLERWDKQGLLIPKRVKGIRYYTEAQRDQVPQILLGNQSPKVKGLIASKNLLLS